MSVRHRRHRGGRLDIEVEHRGDGIIVWRLTGALDASAADRIRPMPAGLAGRPRLVIDLSRVTFVDSVGLGGLADAIRWVRDCNGAAVVACDRPTLTRLLRTRGFARLVPVAETIEEAVAALDPPDSD